MNLDLTPEQEAELNKNFPETPEETLIVPQPEAPTPEPEKPADTGVSPEEILGALQNLGSQLEDLKKKEEPTPEPEKPAAWEPKTWEEVAVRTEESAKKALADKDAELKAAEQVKQENLAKLDKAIGEGIAELEKNGRIPKTIDEKNDIDPGVIAKRELFALASKFNTLDFKSVQDILDQAHLANRHFDYKTFSWVDKSPNPGKDAPVGSSNSSTPPPSGSPDYKLIHGKSLDQLADIGMQE